MDIQEFSMLIQESGIMNDELNEQNVPFFFSQGLRLRVNELDSDKHIQACYVEFLEGYARCCDQASTPPPAGTDLSCDRYSQPLYKKIENTIPTLLANCTTRQFQQSFEHPKKHPEVGLFILHNGKFF